MQTHYSITRYLPVLLYGLLVSGLALAQSEYDTSPDAQSGRQAYGSYFDIGIDSVNLFNGNINLTIPLISQSGRELGVTLKAVYNSQKWEEDSCSGYDCGRYVGGWEIRAGKPEMSFSKKYLGSSQWEMNVYWIDDAGTKHRYQTISGSQYWDNLTLESMDGDGSIVEARSYHDNKVSKLLFPDGSHLVHRHSSADPEEYFYDVMTANGNYLVYDSNGLPTQDTLGRTIGREYFYPGGPNDSAYRYTTTDANGASQVIEIYYQEFYPYDPYAEETSDDEVELITQILLANGNSYQFEYDHEQGFLTKVILPSGAYIRYGYHSDEFDDDHDYVEKRYLSHDGTAGSEEEWQYQYGVMGYNGPRTLTETDPEGNKIVHSFASTGTKYLTQWQTPSDMTLKTVSSTWSNQGVASNGQPDQPRVNEITTVLDSQMTSTKELTYDSDGYLIKEEVEVWRFNDQNPPVALQRDMTYTPATGVVKHLATETLKAINPANGNLEDQGKTEYVYDEYNLTVRTGSVPNHNGDTSQNNRGNVTTIKRYQDATNFLTEHVKYDNLGNVIEQIDPLGHSTLLDWTDSFSDQVDRNSFAFLTETTNPLSQSATLTYDFNTGLVTDATNLRGYTTTTTYDVMNRGTSVMEPNGKETEYSYDDTNRITTKTVTVDTSGNLGQVKSYFDGLNRTIQTRTNDPEGEIYVDTEYDGNGRAKRVTQPYRSGGSQLWTTTTYDELSRPLTVTAPDSSVVTYAYENNQTTVTDQAGNQRRYTYDVLGQMTQVEEPDPTLETPVVTAYEYYGFGPLYQSSQNGQLRTFVHNWLGQKTSETQPEAGTTTFTYDGDGRLASQTDARSITTTLTYDNANRLTQRSYSDSTPTVSFQYDAAGNRTQMTDGLGTATYTYDNMERRIDESRTLTGVTGTFTTEYGYNVKGNLTQATYPSGRVVDYTYAAGGACCDSNSRLASVADGTTSTTLVSSLTYAAAGSTLTKTLGNGASQSGTYNNRLQLTGITATVSSTAVMDFAYGYGTSSQNTGRVLSRVDDIQPEHSANYAYDSIHRLQQVTGGDGSSWGIAWTFDAWGNRLTQTPLGMATGKVGSQTLAYSNNRNTSFTYDAAGNQTNDGLHNYTFNAENQITQMDAGGAVYEYDGDGRRIKKTVGSESTYSFYALGVLVSEFTTTNTGATASSSSDRTTYQTADSLGTTVIIMEASGLVVENNRTLPYGEEWQPTVESGNEHKFTSYQRDGESGLDYAGARYYENTRGRLNSPDKGPMKLRILATLNRYSYVGMDPVNITDPSGNTWLQWAGPPTQYTERGPAQCGAGHVVGWNGDCYSGLFKTGGRYRAGFIEEEGLEERDPYSRLRGRGLTSIYLAGKVGQTFLDPEFASRVSLFRRLAAAGGVDLVFNSAFRTPLDHARVLGQYERALLGFNTGLRDKEPIRPSEVSLHRAGLAVDVNFEFLPSWQREVILRAASGADLSWGGGFETPDLPHFYLDPGEDRGLLIDNAQYNYRRLRRAGE